MNPPQQPDFDTDGERDAWLREALRHAPDADLAPPALLSLAILREAHAGSAGHASAAPGAPARSAQS